MTIKNITFQTGIPEDLRESATILYEEAFGEKISLAVRNKDDRHQLLKNSFLLNHAVCALSGNKLVGIAGYQTSKGSFTGGITYTEIVSQLGFLKGNWATFIFILYERKPKESELVMDGIAVASEYRGKGIGSKLLSEIRNIATKKNLNHVRLDVIDTNPKAKELYLRIGFKSVRNQKFPYLKWLLGFGGVTTMVLTETSNNENEC